MNENDTPSAMVREKRFDDLREFFKNHDHLSIIEIAILLGLSPSTIRKWRGHAGITKEFPFKERPVVKTIDLPKIDDPAVWDCEEWFREYYERRRYGVASIGKIVGRSSRLIRLRLDKYNIKARTHSAAVRSDNPCSTADWLFFYYATREEYLAWAQSSNIVPDSDGGKEWSLRKCSGMAGVVPATVYNWLARINNEGHRINIRDINEALAGKRNPFYGRKHSEEALVKIRAGAKRGYAISRAKVIDQKNQQ